jgi:preprotein translocase subunit SecF
MVDFAQFGNDLYTGKRSVRFVARRRTWYAIGATLVLLSALALLTRGLSLGIEFTGGSEFRISGLQNAAEGPARTAVASVTDGGQVKVSTLGNGSSVRVQTEALTPQENNEVRAALAEAYGVEDQEITAQLVGPSWGEDVSERALLGLVVFLVLVSVVIALYFRTWKMSVAAMVALMHDLVITVGVYALVGFEVTPETVIGFLTILGYSLYDTVVVFDKVRENTEHITASTRQTFGEAANLAVNQTLVRSINTSVVALLPIGAILFFGLFVLGAGSLRDLALALFVGVAVGTYSSVFIATPLLVHLREREPDLKAQAERVRRKRAEVGAPVPARAAAGGGSGRTATLEADPERGDRAGDDGEGMASSGASLFEPASNLRPPAGNQRQQPRRGTTARGRPGGRKR